MPPPYGPIFGPPVEPHTIVSARTSRVDSTRNHTGATTPCGTKTPFPQPTIDHF
jgi:hypothetical protein